MTPHQLNFFRSVPAFSRLADEALREILAGFRPRIYARHEILFLEGDEAAHFFIVVAGRVRLYKISDQGREFTLFMVRARQIFELPPLFDGKPHALSASAWSDVRAYVCSLAHMQAMIQRHLSLHQALTRQLSLLTRHISDIASDLALTDVTTRLARFLLAGARNQGTPTPDGILLTLDLSQSEIATLMGAAREVISRSFRSLERQGVIQRSRREILIRNPNALARLTHGHDLL